MIYKDLIDIKNQLIDIKMDYEYISSEEEEEFYEPEEISIEEKIEMAEEIFNKLKSYCENNGLDILTKPNCNCISYLASLIN